MEKNLSHLKAKNGFARRPSCPKRFQSYFDSCAQIAASATAIDEKIAFTKEGEAALTLFSEKAKLNDKALSKIADSQTRLDGIYADIAELIAKEDEARDIERAKEEERLAEENRAEARKVKKANETALKALDELLGIFRKISTQPEFDRGIAHLTELENYLQKESFDDAQSKIYTKLTNSFSKEVSDIMARIARQKDIRYNLFAIEQYRETYENFKDTKKISLSEENKENIAQMFKYDTSRLFPESAVYYNFVYSAIFGKLNDEDKYQLTMLSVNTPKTDCDDE